MSNNLKRKITRKFFLEEKKKAEKELADKIRGVFLPDKCSSCETEFDKKSKEMAQTWMVVAKDEQKQLMCPECWVNFRKESSLESTQVE